MLNRLFLTSLLTVACATLLTAETPPAAIAEKGDILFADDFRRTNLGPWKVIIPGFRVEDGHLVGLQERADHGAVGRVYLPMQNVVMEFRFRLAGSPRFNVVFDDRNYKGSHAGHICRVAVTQSQIRLGDDKEGIMRNDIFRMRRDPAQRAAADELTRDRSSAAPVNLEPDRWYAMKIELVDDRLRVSLDGTAVGYLKSPGLAHPTKESVHFTVTGMETHFDDVKIWNAESRR